MIHFLQDRDPDGLDKIREIAFINNDSSIILSEMIFVS